jgi:hypothetical protein
MKTLLALGVGLVLGAFYPNYVKPFALNIWGKLKALATPTKKE